MTKPQYIFPAHSRDSVLVGTELNVAANLHVLHLDRWSSLSPSGTAASPGPGRRAPGAGEPGCTSRSGAAGWPSAQVRRLSGEGPLPPPRGVFRFPGVLMCAGGPSETQERYTDPANDLGAQAVLPLRHLRGARASPAKKSGKSTQGACAPLPRCPRSGGRRGESAQVSPMLQLLISACVCSALCIYPVCGFRQPRRGLTAEPCLPRGPCAPPSACPAAPPFV